MNRTLALEMIVFGVALVGAGFCVYELSFETDRVTMFTGLAGGAAGVSWGVMALCGYRRRWWLLLSLAAVCFVLLSQTVTAWFEQIGAGFHAKLPTFLVSLMLILTFGMLLNMLHGQGRNYRGYTKAQTDPSNNESVQPAEPHPIGGQKPSKQAKA